MNRHGFHATTNVDALLVERRRAASPALAAANAALKEQARKTALWLVNDRHSCLTMPAERIVEDCLRALQAIPAAERFGADVLMDGISFVYLHSSRSEKEFHRRFRAVLRIDAEATQ